MPDTLGLSPGQFARAFRAAFPKYRADIQTDEELFQHLQETQPEGMRKLIAPGGPSEGAYLPSPGDWQKSYGATGTRKATPLPTVKATGNALTTGATTALRVVPPVATAVATGLGALPTFGSSIPAGMAATGGAAAAGESLAQKAEEYIGLRDEVDPRLIATAGAFGAIPGLPIAKGFGTAARAAIRGAEGAGLGLVQQETESRLTGAPPPSLGERATVGAFGAAFGGGFGAIEGRQLAKTFEAAAEQVRQRSMTREGLAGTLERIAKDAEFEGLDTIAARRYAREAGRALYQGRELPPMPKPQYPHEYSPELPRNPAKAAMHGGTSTPPIEAGALPAGTQARLRTLGIPEPELKALTFDEAGGILRRAEVEGETFRKRASTPEEHMREVMNDPVAVAEGRRLERRVARKATPPVEAGRIELEGRALLTGERVRDTLGVEPGEAVTRGWARFETDPSGASGYRLLQNRPDLAASPNPQQLDEAVNAEYLKPGSGWAEDPRYAGSEQVRYYRSTRPPQYDQPIGPGLPPPPLIAEGPLPRPKGIAQDLEDAIAGSLNRPNQPVTPRLVNPNPAFTAREAVVPPDARARAAAQKLGTAGTKNALGAIPQFTAADAPALPAPRSGDVPPTSKERAAFLKGSERAAARQAKTLAPPMAAGLKPPPTGKTRPPATPNPSDQGAAAVEAYQKTGSFQKAQQAAQQVLPPPPKDVVMVGEGGDPIGTVQVPGSYDQPVISEAEYNSLYAKGPLDPSGERGAIPLKPTRPHLEFSVPPGDLPALKGWLASNPQHAGEGFYKRAQAALEAKNPTRAWQILQAETLRTGSPTARNKALAFAGMRGEVGRVRQQEAGQRRTDVLPQPKNVTPRQRGQLTMRLSGLKDVGDMPPPTTIYNLPPQVQQRVLRAVKRAQLGRIKGNQDTDYRLFRQVAHQVLEGDAKMRSISRALGLTPEELAKGWTDQVSEAARVLQRLSQLSREIPNIVEEVAAKSGQAAPRGVKVAMKAMSDANDTDEGLQQLYGGLFGLDPSAALQWAKDSAAAMNEVHAAHLLEQQTGKGPLAAFNDLRRAGLTGTIAAFWRNAAVGGLRWNAGIMSDAIGGILSVDPATRRELIGRAKDRVTAAPHLWNTIARPWASSIFEMWPDLSKVALAGRDPRKTLKAISSFSDAEAHFLGLQQQDLPQSMGPPRRTGVQQYVTLIQSANRAQEYPLRALASDLRLRQLVRRRGFDPNTVLNDPSDLSKVFGSPEAAERAVQDAVGYGLDFTFASDTVTGTINKAMIDTINSHPFLSAFQSFPRYAWSAAPRFVWDHSPGVLLDMAVQVASRGKVRLGQRFMRGQQTALASEMLGRRETRLNEISLERGKALQDRMALSKTRAILRRKIDTLERYEEGGTITGQQRQQLSTLQREISETNGALNGQKGYLGRLQTEQQTLQAQSKKLAKGYEESAKAAAPESYGEAIGKAAVGVALWSAAHAIRSDENQQDLPWYKIRVSKGDTDSPDDDTVVDARAFGPLTLYLFMGDLTASIGRDTDTKEFRRLQQEKITAGEHKYEATAAALKESYHGKYSEGQALREAAQLVFGLSPAGGLTAGFYDMLAPEGLTIDNMGESMMSIVGEWLAGPLQPLSDVSNLLSPIFPEEGVIRDASMLAPETPLAELSAPFAKIPGVKQLFPEQYSQTSGEVIRSQSPITRTLGGITLAKPPNEVESVLQEAGVPGNKYYLPRLDDVGLTQQLSKVHSESLKEMYNEFIKDSPDWLALQSPEERRTYLEMPGGPLAFAKTLTWATMQEYGEETMAKLRESPARAAAAKRQLRLLERWSEGTLPPEDPEDQQPQAPPPAPSRGLPPPPRF